MSQFHQKSPCPRKVSFPLLTLSTVILNEGPSPPPLFYWHMNGRAILWGWFCNGCSRFVAPIFYCWLLTSLLASCWSVCLCMIDCSTHTDSLADLTYCWVEGSKGLIPWICISACLHASMSRKILQFSYGFTVLIPGGGVRWGNIYPLIYFGYLCYTSPQSWAR